MTTHTDPLEQLCGLCGIQTDYFDIWGNRRAVSRETLVALLGAMGIGVNVEHDIGRALGDWQARQAQALLPPVKVVRESNQPVTVSLTVRYPIRDEQVDWRLVFEEGNEHAGQARLKDLVASEPTRLGDETVVSCALLLPVNVPIGYHDLEVAIGEQRAVARIIVAPAACFQPPPFVRQARIWGPAVQLYSVRSARDWGVGDFTTLGELAEGFGKLGAGIVGVNPLHALFLHDPNRASPYSPSSRLWLNVVYIDPEAMPEYNDCKSANRRVTSDPFQERLKNVRQNRWVDYQGVLSLKREVFEILYFYFCKGHLERNSEYAQEFREFQSDSGVQLHRAALCDALQEHFTSDNPDVWGWPVWPAEYRDPNSTEVAAFAEQHRERVEFFEYLQWHAHQQLAKAEQKARQAGVVLYGDLAVSSDVGGSDIWSNQSVYSLQASVGAPPDDFNLEGQNWGLPPLIPNRLAESRYEPFIALLRQNMCNTGALRIDHVMSMVRLFWIPKGGKPSQGAYIRYPFADLLGILALESQRNSCLIIGEDLGTVPNEMRAAMPENNLLSYKVLYFEKDSQSEFKPPTAYPTKALVTVSTHDLPTLSGYWKGLDIDERAKLGQIPSEQVRKQQHDERARDRDRLRSALQRESLAPPVGGSDKEPVTEMDEALARAIHTYAARTPCHVMVFQLEDLLGEQYQVNLPGTVAERPNWRRRISLTLEEIIQDTRTRDLCAVLRQERGAAR